MPDESATANPMQISLDKLHKKIERESRFTRSLVVVCTAAILGVSLVPVKIMLADLPVLIFNEFFAKVDSMHKQWTYLDRVDATAAANAKKIAGPAGSQ